MKGTQVGQSDKMMGTAIPENEFHEDSASDAAAVKPPTTGYTTPPPLGLQLSPQAALPLLLPDTGHRCCYCLKGNPPVSKELQIRNPIRAPQLSRSLTAKKEISDFYGTRYIPSHCWTGKSCKMQTQNKTQQLILHYGTKIQFLL